MSKHSLKSKKRHPNAPRERFEIGHPFLKCTKKRWACSVAMERLIRLPWPPTKTSKNGSQGDWRGKARAARGYKALCGKECMAQGIRPMGCDSVLVEITFHPPRAARFDLDNMLSRAKQGLDAVSDAIAVDDADWKQITLVRGEKIKNGALLVHIKSATEEFKK